MYLDRMKINKIMAEKSMTITDLSIIYGVTRGRMSVILNSKKVSPVTIGRLAKALSVEIDDIIIG